MVLWDSVQPGFLRAVCAGKGRLEENLDRYERAHPGRFLTFAQANWTLVHTNDFGARLGLQLEDSVRRGARGLKVWKNLGLQRRDEQGALIVCYPEDLGWVSHMLDVYRNFNADIAARLRRRLARISPGPQGGS